MLFLVLGLVLAAFGLLIVALSTANTVFAWVSVTVSVLAAGLLVFDWLRGRRRAREAAEEAEPDPVLARPERPFGDQPPPLTETRRSGSTRADRRGEPAHPDSPRADLPEAGGGLGRSDVLEDEVDTGPRGEPAAVRDEPVREEPVRDDPPADAPAQDVHSQDVEDVEDEVAAPEPEQAEPEPRDVPAEEPERQERTAVLSGRRAEEARRAIVDEHGEPGEEPTDATDLLIVTDLRSEVRVVDERPRYHLAACPYLLDKPTIPLPVAEARQLGFTPCARCGPDATLAAQHRATR